RTRRLAAVRRDQALLRAVASQRLGACAKPRAHERAVRPQHQRRCETPAVDDAARRDDRRGRGEIDDRRYQRKRAAAAAVSSRLRALRDEEIRTGFTCEARLVETLQPDAGEPEIA